MPGMNSGLNPADPTLVAAFRSALLHQGAIAIIILAFLWLLWATARTWADEHAGRRSRKTAQDRAAPGRPRGGGCCAWGSA